jgi:WD40 repeat protein
VGFINAYAADRSVLCVENMRCIKHVHSVCLCCTLLQDVLYSSDGSQVLSCSSDGTVRIWDAKTCEQLHGFRWGRAGVLGLGLWFMQAAAVSPHTVEQLTGVRSDRLCLCGIGRCHALGRQSVKLPLG